MLASPHRPTRAREESFRGVAFAALRAATRTYRSTDPVACRAQTRTVSVGGEAGCLSVFSSRTNAPVHPSAHHHHHTSPLLPSATRTFGQETIDPGSECCCWLGTGGVVVRPGKFRQSAGTQTRDSPTPFVSIQCPAATTPPPPPPPCFLHRLRLGSPVTN